MAIIGCMALPKDFKLSVTIADDKKLKHHSVTVAAYYNQNVHNGDAWCDFTISFEAYGRNASGAIKELRKLTDERGLSFFLDIDEKEVKLIDERIEKATKEVL